MQLLAAAIPVAAHHGTGASYDLSNPITLQGTVTEFHYANPHPQLFFDVTDDKGEVTHWSGEFYPNPAQLIQGGWGTKAVGSGIRPGHENHDHAGAGAGGHQGRRDSEAAE